MEKISILIADDHRLVREAWRIFLHKDHRFAVVAEAASAEEAVALAKKLRPDIVLLDINLPDMNGVKATPLIRKFSPITKILAVSLYTQPTYVKQIMQKGAMGYVTKTSPLEELSKALVEILEGRKYICKEIRDILSTQLNAPINQQQVLHSLTQRELEIIALIRNGNTSKEMAAALRITAKTVNTHRYNILKKLGYKNASSLVNFMNRSGIF